MSTELLAAIEILPKDAGDVCIQVDWSILTVPAAKFIAKTVSRLVMLFWVNLLNFVQGEINFNVLFKGLNRN